MNRCDSGRRMSCFVTSAADQWQVNEKIVGTGLWSCICVVVVTHQGCSHV